MDPILIQSLSAGGPVGVLAFFIFYMYRKNGKSNERRWNQMVKDLLDLRREDLQIRRDDIKSRQENTVVLTELKTAINLWTSQINRQL